MVQQLYCHLDVSGLARNDDESLALASCRGRTVHAYAHRTWFHDLDLACAHMPDLVDLRTTLANDATNEVVGDIDLLRLQLLRSTMRAASVWV